MGTLNLGILAHVDAGKTTLTERLLFAGGVIDEVGSVDHGTTQTDSLALERQRGITIKTAVVSFAVNGVTINLIDTPGHPDFIAEVERVLNVLDGAVLVISAVEGVQAQTRVLMRTLRRLGVPTLIFVNKVDRVGARDDALLQQISDRLTPAIIPMGSVCGLGTRTATFGPYSAGNPAFVTRAMQVLADNDDAMLASYVADRTIPDGRLRQAIAAQTRLGLVHPVYFGSAITGAGHDPLVDGILHFLPVTESGSDDPVSGTVFKVERGPAGEKIAYLRMFAGTLQIRDQVRFGDLGTGKVTAIEVFADGRTVRQKAVTAGHIARVSGLADVHIGDTIGAARTAAGHYFTPPSLETVVVPCHSEEKGRLHVGLSQLAEQDPLINLRQDDFRRELYVSLYGEVQKEVIQATLASEYGIDVTFRETTAICVERPAGSGAAIDVIGKGGNPYSATVGLRVDPAPAESGIEFRCDVGIEGIPIHAFKDTGVFRAAVEKTIRTALQEGIYGWQVTDCVVTMTRSGFTPATHAKDFRLLTPLVLMAALKQAGTVVCEPVHRFRLDIPADAIGRVLPALARLNAVPETPSVQGAMCILEGEIRAAKVHRLQQQMSGLTSGEGVLESTLDHYQPIRGPIPTRRRTSQDPFNRTEYLRRMRRGN
ncbi:MAG TPA: translation factor GTPase family protein [Mycobacteriales bacterium]|nr:translation factor GTPase family protein [Mycobacteriales bacterium]